MRMIKFRMWLLRKTFFFNRKKYMKKYIHLLKKAGMIIEGTPNWINPDVYFDSKNYSMITLHDGVTISREVMFLTHDYSIFHSLSHTHMLDCEDKILFLKPIVLEEGCFVGARVSLLPGTHIGKYSIIGSGAVVKGNIPEKSIVIGNPAKIVGNVDDWNKKHLELGDYISEKENITNHRKY